MNVIANFKILENKVEIVNTRVQCNLVCFDNWLSTLHHYKIIPIKNQISGKRSNLIWDIKSIHLFSMNSPQNSALNIILWVKKKMKFK